MSKTIHPIWDVIIVGAGPAGCAAAMVLVRARRKVLLIDDGNPRNIRSQGIHNYLTRDGLLPSEFREITHNDLKTYGVEFVNARATAARQLDKHGFEIKDNKNRVHLSRRLLIATGVTDNIPAIPGMKEMWGRGVYHCPFCDGWGLHDKVVGLYAKRFNGYGMSLALRQLTDKVILFTDEAKYLKPKQREHLAARGIDVVGGAVARLTCAEEKITCVTLKDGSSVGCDVVFIHHGSKFNNALIKQLGGKCNSKGAALTNRRQQCSVRGVYVAGDAAYDMQMVAVAAAEGVKAAVTIHNDLLKTDNAMVQTSADPVPSYK
ncbi:MAG: NAD(P)/FAD-dependent oxidoreductase [Bacteroidota bacterium]